jgi:single-stranded DNA-binding protein
MTLARISFAGQIKKAEPKTAGGKTLIEVSVCKKQKGRNGAEDTFLWLRVNCWEPAEFQLERLVKGAFIAGSGDLSTRAWTDKDGKNQVSLEVRCSSFDFEVETGADREAAPAPRPASRSVASAVDDTEVPF